MRAQEESSDPLMSEDNASLEPDCEFEVDLHRVRKVVEVYSHRATNDLLADEWILHDVYIANDGRSCYILLRMKDLTCPRCGGAADIEVLSDGESYRYVCQKECG